MKAVILAAGMGTRLGTLVPKPLTSLTNEKTILDFQVEKLTGVVERDEIIAVVGYKKEIVMEKFPDLIFLYNSDYARTNTSKSLLLALRKVREDTLFMNGDVYFDDGVLELLVSSRRSSCLVNSAECGEEEVKYSLRADGTIAEISKTVDAPCGEALGINLIRQEDLDAVRGALERVADSDYFEKAFEDLLSAGRIVLEPVDVGPLYCREIDFEEDLREVVEHLARG